MEKWDGELISDVAAMDDRPCVLAGHSVSCLMDGGGTAWESMLVDDAWVSAIDAGPNRLARVDLGRQQLELLDSNGTATANWPLPSDAGFAVFSGVAVDGSHVLLAARDRHHHVVGRDDFLERWSKSDNCLILITSLPPRREVRPPPT